MDLHWLACSLLCTSSNDLKFTWVEVCEIMNLSFHGCCCIKKNFRLVSKKTCPSLSTPAPPCPHLPLPVHTCPSLSTPAPPCSHLPLPVHTCPSLSAPAPPHPHLPLPVHTCPSLFTPAPPRPHPSIPIWTIQLYAHITTYLVHNNLQSGFSVNSIDTWC